MPPDAFTFETSGQLVMQTAIGGAGTLFGPLVGATVWLYLSDFFQTTLHLGATWKLVLGVVFVVVKRYNNPDPETLPFLTALAREGRRIAAFSPYRPGISEAEQARIDPFLHDTDTRIDDALERPGPPLEIWQLDGPGS